MWSGLKKQVQTPNQGEENCSCVLYSANTHGDDIG